MRRIAPLVLLLACWISTPLRGAEIVAHRGASASAPENTLAAFSLAWKQQADAVELDIYRTRDGKIVVIHDPSTRRTTGRDRRVADSTLAELKSLDAGAWKGAAWKGERIPSLREVLAAKPANKRIFIEIKCGPEVLPELRRVIQESGQAATGLALIAFNYETLKQAKEQCPQLPAYWLISSNRRNGQPPSIDALLDKAREAHFDGLDLSYRFVVDRPTVDRIHRAGLKLYAWTVNDPEIARSLVELGFDGITTDSPGLVREQLALDKRSSVLVPSEHPKFVLSGSLAADEACQAAAADTRFAYAVDNRVVAKYDRSTGKRLGTSQGAAKHLNSALLWHDRVFCAHSNFPATPAESEIMMLDPDSMSLEPWKEFGPYRGSLTWAIRDQQHWWCCFAVYGTANFQTSLVKFDDEWQERGVWYFPSTVVGDLGGASISGGCWYRGQLLATGHDRKVIYRLRLPIKGDTLELIDVLSSPFPGQGIATDPTMSGLVGIDRAKQRIVFAELQE